MTESGVTHYLYSVFIYKIDHSKCTKHLSETKKQITRYINIMIRVSMSSYCTKIIQITLYYTCKYSCLHAHACTYILRSYIKILDKAIRTKIYVLIYMQKLKKQLFLEKKYSKQNFNVIVFYRGVISKIRI